MQLLVPLLILLESGLTAQVIQLPQTPQNWATTTVVGGFATPHTVPLLPLFGGANSIFKDPTYGNRILRVSDGNTLIAPLGQAYANYSVISSPSAESNIWRKDDTMFYLGSPCCGGILLFSFNPSTFQASVLSTSQLHAVGGSPEFSFTDNNALYGAPSMNFVRYDVVAHTTTTLFNFSTAGIISGNNGDPSVSATEKLVSPACGPQQDQWTCALVYCVRSGPYCRAGQYAILDFTQGIQPFGASSFTPQSGGPNWNAAGTIHNVRIGKEGRYVAITGGVGAYQTVWDLQTMTTTVIPNSAIVNGGHKAQGYGNMAFGASLAGDYGPQLTQIDYAAPNTYLNMLPINPNPPWAGGISDYPSYQNASPYAAVPIFGSNESFGGPGTPNEKLGTGQVTATEMDGIMQKVWVFASTHAPAVTSVYNGGGPLYAQAVSVAAGGTGYSVGDTGTISGCGSRDATYTVATVSGGGVATITIMSPGAQYYSVAGCSTTAASGSGSGMTITIASFFWNTGKNFYLNTRGNVSQDGKYYLFNSPMDGTLGTDAEYPTTNTRIDAFIVELTPLTPGMASSITPGSTQALFLTHTPDMQACTATIYRDSGRSVLVASASETVRDGRSSQILVGGLTASTTYYTRTACGGGNETILSSFTTRALGSGTYRFPFMLSSSQPIKYCADAALTTGCTSLAPATAQTIPVPAHSVVYAKIGLAGSTTVLIAP